MDSSKKRLKNHLLFNQHLFHVHKGGGAYPQKLCDYSLRFPRLSSTFVLHKLLHWATKMTGQKGAWVFSTNYDPTKMS